MATRDKVVASEIGFLSDKDLGTRTESFVTLLERFSAFIERSFAGTYLIDVVVVGYFPQSRDLKSSVPDPRQSATHG